MPIADLGAPNQDFKYKWETTKVLLKNELLEGQNVIFHCRGGKGRAGTIAAIILADFGHEKKEAIDLVRERRKGAIETKVQEDFINSYQVIK
jgi:ADP-ribosyl-[dinitrogen reductase] hydrolase